MPILSKAGCNGGGCHGAIAGKAGFRLSLFGYDPKSDYLTITRDARGRRVDLADPGTSLLLTKPTMALPHKGGKRLDVGSDDYKTARRLDRGGLPRPQGWREDARRDRPRARGERGGAGAEGRARRHGPLLRRLHARRHPLGTVHVGRRDGRHRRSVGRRERDRPRRGGRDGLVFLADRRGERDRALPPCRVARRLRRRPAGQRDRRAQSRPARAAASQALAAVRRGHVPPPRVPRHDRPAADSRGGPRVPRRPSPAKKQRLVDLLLARPEFIDYWAYKWSDILLVSGAKLRPAAIDAYYRWIRDRVAENTPVGPVRPPRSSRPAGRASRTAPPTSTRCTRIPRRWPRTWPRRSSRSRSTARSATTIRSRSGPTTNTIPSPTCFRGCGPRAGAARSAAATACARSTRRRRATSSSRRRASRSPRLRSTARPLPMDDAGDRREPLAAWLTSPDNPYFTRAIVNRVWANFFGLGLVEPVDDLRTTQSGEQRKAALGRCVRSRSSTATTSRP